MGNLKENKRQRTKLCSSGTGVLKNYLNAWQKNGNRLKGLEYL